MNTLSSNIHLQELSSAADELVENEQHLDDKNLVFVRCLKYKIVCDEEEKALTELLWQSRILDNKMTFMHYIRTISVKLGSITSSMLGRSNHTVSDLPSLLEELQYCSKHLNAFKEDEDD